MPLHDYICDDCGKISANIVIQSKHPRSVTCVCGCEMHIHYGRINFNGHTPQAQSSTQRHNSMYGKYHHGFGQVVRDYDHKKQLLKEYDVSEAADPVGGSRSWRDQVPSNGINQTGQGLPGAVELSETEAKSMMAGAEPAGDLREKLQRSIQKGQ